ncbi:hypothetical protein PMI10_02717 [Flavobacterium sp. CF136]|nr:hypothetical protein PMI10_02717 [Flavobacterium sp. CF136]
MRITALLICFFMHLACLSQTSSELFDKTKMEYRGSKADQAKLLLRTVKIWGKIEKKEPHIDQAFLNLLENKPELNKEKLKEYLQKNSIVDNEICGAVDRDISSILLDGRKVYAKYFVIHDMSTPAYANSFPTNINDSSWSRNNLNSWNWSKGKEPAHAIITRTGLSKTLNDFEKGWRATKFEINKGISCRGLFVHIELLQPRVYPPGTAVSAPVAPVPGFTDLQYKRLALLYVCAGVRKGEWLVPAFHVNIDEGQKDGHDDPQNFELSKFTNEVISLVKHIKTL